MPNKSKGKKNQTNNKAINRIRLIYIIDVKTISQKILITMINMVKASSGKYASTDGEYYYSRQNGKKNQRDIVNI